MSTFRSNCPCLFLMPEVTRKTVILFFSDCVAMHCHVEGNKARSLCASVIICRYDVLSRLDLSLQSLFSRAQAQNLNPTPVNSHVASPSTKFRGAIAHPALHSFTWACPQFGVVNSLVLSRQTLCVNVTV